MPIEPPPSRYRVVERGRRLEVIDTRAAASPVTARPAPATVTSGARTIRPVSALKPASNAGLSTGQTFTTMRLYDAKAPRKVQLDAAAASMLGRVRLIAFVVALAWFIAVIWQPWLAVLPLFLLARNGLGPTIRKRITAWLDRYALD